MDLHEAARDLARKHYDLDPPILAIYDCSSNDVVRLLQVDADTPAMGVQPLGFGASPPNRPYPLVLVVVTPDEHQQIVAGTLSLPDGWTLGPPVPNPLEERRCRMLAEAVARCDERPFLFETVGQVECDWDVKVLHHLDCLRDPALFRRAVEISDMLEAFRKGLDGCMNEPTRREREERALDALLVSVLRMPDDDDPKWLPELTAADRAALDALPADFVDRLLAGERLVQDRASNEPGK